MRTILAAAWTAVCLVPGVALADEDEPDDEKPEVAEEKPKSGGDEGGEAVAVGKSSRRMTMPGGKVLLNTIIETNLGKGAVGKPVSVAPDIWYGASDKLTLGLVHSGRGISGFLTEAGRGLCFGDKQGTCALGLGKIYTTAGVEARIGLTEGGFPLALALGGYALAFDPELVMAGKVGIVGRGGGGSISIELAPALFVGITQRDLNKEVLTFPVTLFLNVSPSFAIALQSGINTPLQKAADNYEIPAAAGFAWWVSPKFSIDVAFGLTAVADKNDMTKAFDGRSLSVGVGYGM